MIPILLLPLASIFLSVGSMLENPVISSFGNAIFSRLPFLYAIAIAYGFSKNRSGIAIITSAVGFFVLQDVVTAIHPDNNLYVLLGLVSGFLSAGVYNWLYRFEFKGFFEIFSENRIAPLVNALVHYGLGLMVGKFLPIFSKAIYQLAVWLSEQGQWGVFLYGVLNRLLLPFGLHHNLNYYLWYQFGDYENVHGDLYRFIAGDPSSGTYMSGFFVIMMFGLPAILFAFYFALSKENRRYIKRPLKN